MIYALYLFCKHYKFEYQINVFFLQRNMLGTRNLHEILADREQISATMQNTLDETTDAWGIKVERVEMCVCTVS